MAKTRRQELILAGDIGGTKTSLGIFVPGKARPSSIALETFSSREAKNLEEIIERFLSRYPVPVASACFAVAGPVVRGRSRTTNLPWKIREKKLKKHFGWQNVNIINDIVAISLALPFLRSGETKALNRARASREGTKLLVAPGTGLGVAFLAFHMGKPLAIPSEGGHADFAPTTKEEVDLWFYLRKDFSHVSIERVLGGAGLVRIYSWLRDSGKFREPIYLPKMFAEMAPAKAITTAALERGNRLCIKALKVYVSILGSVSGNLALTGMATGGLFLGGGIPPRILPFLKEGTFIDAFIHKGRFKPMLEKIPVRVILNDRAPLLGAALYAMP